MPNDLIISNPQIGISSSPHLGFGDMRNMDVSSVPGIAQMNNVASKKSSTTIDGQPMWFVQDPADPKDFYCLDVAGVVYNSANYGATWAELADKAGAGEGLAIWKDYLFVFGTTGIYTYGPLSGSPNWKDDFATIGTAPWHPTHVSKNDGNLYFGCGRYIGLISEDTDFADGDGGTYSITLGTSGDNSLDLPEDYIIKCLEELGNSLMIGTYQGTGNVKIADIFPWDRSSVSYGQPITMEDYGVHALKTINQQLYISAGNEGKIFRSNGAQAVQVAQIPDSIATRKDTSIGITGYPGAMAKYKGKLFFGLGSTVAVDGMGVWSLMETSQGNVLTLEHGISSGNWGVSNKLQASCIIPASGEELLIGWIDNTTTGVDKTLIAGSKYAYGTAYTDCYFDSAFYNVGTNLNKRVFTELEFQLAKDIAANEGIRLAYRVALDDSFTTIGTYTNSEFTGTSHHVTATIPACEFLQIRVSLTGTTTTPQWKNLTLR